MLLMMSFHWICWLCTEWWLSLPKHNSSFNCYILFISVQLLWVPEDRSFEGFLFLFVSLVYLARNYVSFYKRFESVVNHLTSVSVFIVIRHVQSQIYILNGWLAETMLTFFIWYYFLERNKYISCKLNVMLK